MGRNLWINSVTFSRDFTVLVWDDLLGLFPPRPDPVTPEGLRHWLAEVRLRGALEPIIYEVWRSRPDGWSENDVAHAWDQGKPLRIEGCYDSLTLSTLEQMPELDYQPPEWRGPEHFAEAFAHTPLSLQAAPIAFFFQPELDRLEKSLEEPIFALGIL